MKTKCQAFYCPRCGGEFLLKVQEHVDFYCGECRCEQLKPMRLPHRVLQRRIARRDKPCSN